MPHLQCYQILLRPIAQRKINLDLWKISIAPASSTTSVVAFIYDDDSLRIELPRRLAETTRAYLVEDDLAVSMRLTYAETSDQYLERSERWLAPQLLNSESASRRLACGFCHHPLLSNKGEEGDATIERVLPLPSGRWDEMQDYLICYEGQATVDFSSASTYGQRKTLLEDETVLVAHRLDIGAAASVMAATGYGDDSRDDGDRPSAKNHLAIAAGLVDRDPTALVRGSRPWRVAVGGATLTCSLCASHLGFAPVELPDTYRLLKHRLVQLSSATTPPPPHRLLAVSSFVVHEMIRYAETRAIFAFTVSDDAERHRRLLLLRLVSWDTTAASTSDAERGDEDGVYRIREWKRRAKILFEETAGVAAAAAATESAQWTWTSQDLCCPPDGREERAGAPAVSDTSKTDPSASLVRLCLSAHEWEELRTELRDASRFYAGEVVAATVAAKLGPAAIPPEGGGIGLASISL